MTDVWRDLVERAHHLALCVFKGSTKADYERARHNAAVLANAIDHARQNEQLRAAKQVAAVATGEQDKPSAVCTPEDHADLKQIAWGEGYAVGCLKEKALREALEEFVDVCDHAPPLELMRRVSMACESARTALSTSNDSGE